MASSQRNISVAEFFAKNRHLLGFDVPQRAVLTTVKEAVDNALDACEEGGILPEVWVEIDTLPRGRCRISVEDNGPGIVEAQIARIFGKLLYGSKFHRLAQSRGQQGMGISAAGLYAQLTTGEPMHIVSRVAGHPQAHELLVTIDTQKNQPKIHRRRTRDWSRKHGTRVSLVMDGQYVHGQHSVLLYLKLCAVVNPHVSLHLREPDGNELSWQRSLRRKPRQPERIRPHPAGIELGMLMSMLKSSSHRTLSAFLQHEFSQVGAVRAREIIRRAGEGLGARSLTRRISRTKVAALHRAIARTAVPAPPADCVVPIGEAALRRGLSRELPGRFLTVASRPPAVYRGNPFVIEVGMSYGRQDAPHVVVDEDGHLRRTTGAVPGGSGSPVRLLRFANRVPLLYQQSHCAITEAVTSVNWKRYGLEQPANALPLGPMVIVVHVASVCVPFTSESKEAIASYPEIARELELALQQCGRRLGAHLRTDRKLERELQRREAIEAYLPHVADAMQSLLGPAADRERLIPTLETLLAKNRRVP